MLERVSPSAECAAHHILRQLEGPVRSNRRLGSSFWRNGSNDLDVPPWWTLYLESVRDKNASPLSRPRLSTAAITGPSTKRFHKAKPTPVTSRTFSHTYVQTQLASTQILTEETNTQPRIRIRVGGLKDDGQKQWVRGAGPDLVESEQDHAVKDSISGRRRARLADKWKSFLQSDHKEQQASALLHWYSSSDGRVELTYALRAFEYIPRNQRTEKEYETAVDVAIKLQRYSDVIRTVQEAMLQTPGPETFVRFLALCISKSLWNTASELWKDVDPTLKMKLWSSTVDPLSKKKGFAREYSTHFDAISDLPSKLVTVLDRLNKQDPSLAAQRSLLIDLYKHLAQFVVESERIMNIITGEGISRMLSGQYQLGLKNVLHYDALATLHRLPERGTKSQLAILIYNNLKSVRQPSFIPKWVFGSMLEICWAGNQPSKIYRSLLEDYKAVYGHSDHNMFIQVMKVCASLGEVGDVLAIFDDFHRYFKNPSAEQVDPLVRVYANVGDYHNAQLQFDQIEARFNIKPSTKNWDSLLLAYSRSDKSDLTYQKFEQMKRSGATPTEYSWSILVAVATKRGDTAHARILVQQARGAGVTPPLAMLGALVDSYLMNDRPSEALHLALAASKASRITQRSPVRLWNSLIRYYAFKNNSEAILRTQEKMKELNIKPDSMTYAALMTALVVQRRTTDAAQILRTLHFSQVLNANEIHYSILIHGFAMEGKAEFASVIYREMLERFPRASPSAKLSMLYVKGLRAEGKARAGYLSGEPYNKPDFVPLAHEIDRVLDEISPIDLVSTGPSPGFSRRVVRSDLEDAYFGSLITFLQRNHSHGSAEDIINLKKQGSVGSLHASATGSSWISTLKNLSQEMENSIESQDWDKVSAIWANTLAVALKNCASRVAPKQHQSKQSEQIAKVDDVSPGKIEEPTFKSMIPKQYAEPKTSAKALRILPAHRYVLSRQISLFIQALEKQSKYVEIIQTMQKLRQFGFVMSSKNLNGLIQSLCRSPDAEHGLLAYELFQKFLLPHAPSWDVILRGKWIRPSDEISQSERAREKTTDKRENRTAIEKRSPGQHMPTYYTMVHLAIVWLKASRSSSRGDNTLKWRLEDRAYPTVRLVLRTPYLRDRLQGVLLRGQKVVGDPFKRPRQPIETDFSGVQGSTLLLDKMSPESLEELQASLNMEDTESASQDLPAKEILNGQVQDSRVVLPAQGRFESRNERQARIASSKKRRHQDLLLVKQQIRRDSRKSPEMVASSIRGSAAVRSSDITPHSIGPSHVDSFFGGSDRPAESNDQKTQPARKTAKSRTRISSKMTNVLRRDRFRPMYQPTAISARRQQGSIRTRALTQRQGVVMTPSQRTQRQRKSSSPVSQPLSIREVKSTGRPRNVTNYGALTVLRRRLRRSAVSRPIRLAKVYKTKVEALQTSTTSMRHISPSLSRPTRTNTNNQRSPRLWQSTVTQRNA